MTSGRESASSCRAPFAGAQTARSSPIRRSLLVACATALALAGCGTGGGHAVPRGNPESRHTTSAIDTYAQVEFLRALLVASSDGYYAGGSADDARSQLRRARSAFDSLQHPPRAAAAGLDHEGLAPPRAGGRGVPGGGPPPPPPGPARPPSH